MHTYEFILEELREFEMTQYRAWCDQLEAKSWAKLDEPLLRRLPLEEGAAWVGLLMVNFPGSLVSLLREGKYFKLMELAVPEDCDAPENFDVSEDFDEDSGVVLMVASPRRWGPQGRSAKEGRRGPTMAITRCRR